MAGESTFLAYREPGEELQYYIPSAHSQQVFHFFAFADAPNLKIPMQRLKLPSEVDFVYQDKSLDISKEAQLKLLENTINALQAGEGQKVVISRYKLIENKIAALELLRRLDKLYPQATVYLFSHPQAGTWIGASPENLLSVKDGLLKTASLAGTKLWAQRDTFGEKEFKEQGIVTDEIKKQLAESGIENVKIANREFKKAGNLAHLYTEISAQVSTDLDWSSIAENLHPTPAVGGHPRQWALNFIQQNELYKRRYYTGYFGWVNKESKHAQFWVNLRCAEFLAPRHLAIYVGGGITAESNALAEWQETEDKSQTILQALN